MTEKSKRMENNIDGIVSATITEQPISFKVGKKRYNIFPASLGKVLMYQRLFNAMGLPFSDGEPEKAVYLSVTEHREEALRLVSYATLPSDDCLYEDNVEERMKEFADFDAAELSKIVLSILLQDRSEIIKGEYGILLESKRFDKLAKAKKGGSVDFGGKTIWGTLLDTACERYGWSFRYVVWGISLANLRLLVSDRIKSLYFTDEEKKKLHVSTDGVTINVKDTKDLSDFIRAQNWE